MPELNMDKILTGTPEKAFNNARLKLADDYDDQSAHDFYCVYKDAPLDFILAHSRDIFSETYYGYPFYLNLITNVTLCPTVYSKELAKVNEFLSLAKKKNIPANQYSKYEILQERLTELTNAYMVLATGFNDFVYNTEGAGEFVKEVTNALYEIRKETNDAIKNKDDVQMGYINKDLDHIAGSILLSNRSVYTSILMGVLLVKEYPKYGPLLASVTDEYVHPAYDANSLTNGRRAVNLIKRLMKSDLVVQILKSANINNLMHKWYVIANLDADELVPEPIVESHESPLEFNPMVDGSNLADLKFFIESMKEDPDTECERYDMYRNKVARYTADLENFGDYDDLNEAQQSAYSSLSINESCCEAEMLMLEWEDDGTPNAVIQRHIMTSGERAAAKAEADKKKLSLQKTVENTNKQTDIDYSTEAEICKEIQKAIKEVADIIPAESASDKEDNDKVLSDARKTYAECKRAIGDNDFPTAKKQLEALREEITSNDDTIQESFNPELDAQLTAFLEGEDDHDSYNTTPPEKPKRDLADKIQDKALDKAAKDSERLAKHDERNQKIKNAANAVAEAPKRVANDVKDTVNGWDKMDDNRRKEFMLKPGYRHKIFKVFKDAVMFGVAGSCKLAFIPVLGLFKYCSTLKDKRIRAELSKELDAEIKICEEKITDANNENDKEKKYELMRIKDKLEAERIRVRTNSKYI